MIPLFVLQFVLLVAMLASSINSNQPICEIVILYREPPHQDLERVRTAGNRFARDGKVPRETAGTRHTSPQLSRRVKRKGAAPLSRAKELAARAIRAFAEYACLLSM
jgi:hypothetical protein